jgi:hypothetical protein
MFSSSPSPFFEALKSAAAARDPFLIGLLQPSHAAGSAVLTILSSRGTGLSLPGFSPKVNDFIILKSTTAVRTGERRENYLQSSCI